MKAPPPTRRPWRELPLVLGVLTGWALCWRFGAAFVFEAPTRFFGYGWPGYVNNAWMVVHRQDLGYDGFRKPLHGLILGGAGELLGRYDHGAILVGSLAVGLLVLAAGVGARALSGPWAGAVAAASLPLVPHNVDAVRWANNYPLLGACAGACLALCLCAARWPSALLGLAAGVAGGLAWGVDGRGALMATAAGALLPLGLLKRRDLQGWLMPLFFVLGMGVGPLSERILALPGAPHLALQEGLAFQREVALRWSTQVRDPALEAACGAEPPHELPSFEALQRPCAQQMMRYNLEKILPRHLPFGVVWTGWLSLLVLLPGRQGWRGSLRGLAFCGVALLPLLLEARWVPLPDRYVVPRAMLLAVLAPAGLLRLVGSLGKGGPWLAGPVAVAAFVWVWATDPSLRREPTTLDLNHYFAMRERSIAAVQAALKDQPAPFIDCSEHYVATALLPRITSEAPPLLRVQEADRCLSYIATAPVGALFAADANIRLRQRARTTLGGPVSFDAARMQASGWQAELSEETFQLWRRIRVE